MLTGMLAPTNGYAVVSGKDIRTEMGAVRQEIGICLQHDCLFPELTVREHIQFFARIKGMYSNLPHAEAEEKVDSSIQDVALSEKRNTLSKNLSGGMKRKLSVAIAFCGDSKTVLLDEPTSGMVSFLEGNYLQQESHGCNAHKASCLFPVGSIFETIHVECNSSVSPGSLHHPDNTFHGKLMKV